MTITHSLRSALSFPRTPSFPSRAPCRPLPCLYPPVPAALQLGQQRVRLHPRAGLHPRSGSSASGSTHTSPNAAHNCHYHTSRPCLNKPKLFPSYKKSGHGNFLKKQQDAYKKSLGQYMHGRDPNEPIKTIALLGRANVGKSTLFNRILGATKGAAGKKKQLVSRKAGTTRDRQSGVGVFGSTVVRITDTGGLEDLPDTMQSNLLSQMRGQVRQAVEEADVVFFVIDAKAGITELDRELAKELRVTSFGAVMGGVKPARDRLAWDPHEVVGENSFRSVDAGDLDAGGEPAGRGGPPPIRGGTRRDPWPDHYEAEEEPSHDRFCAGKTACGKPVILVANKADFSFIGEYAIDCYELGLGDPVPISAYHNHGMDDLYDRLTLELDDHPESEEEASAQEICAETERRAGLPPGSLTPPSRRTSDPKWLLNKDAVTGEKVLKRSGTGYIQGVEFAGFEQDVDKQQYDEWACDDVGFGEVERKQLKEFEALLKEKENLQEQMRRAADADPNEDDIAWEKKTRFLELLDAEEAAAAGEDGTMW